MSDISDDRPIRSSTNLFITIILAILNLISAVYYSKFAADNPRCDIIHTAPGYLFWTTFISFVMVIQQIFLIYFGKSIVDKGMNSSYRNSAYFVNMSDEQMKEYTKSLVVAVSYIIIAMSLQFLLVSINANRCTF